MIKPRRWWLGLIPLALIWITANWIETSLVERYLAGRVNDAAEAVPLRKVNVAVAGRDVSVSGEAFSEKGRDVAPAATNAVWGIRQMQSETRLIPEAKPFSWSATRSGNQVVLEGNVPTPAVRSKILGTAQAKIDSRAIRVVNRISDAITAKVREVQIVDRMDYARGAPQEFASMAELGLAQLDELPDGKVVIKDGNVSISGTAKDDATRDAITAALGKLPSGFTLAESDVSVPGYKFGAVKDAEAATLTLTGSVPDVNTKTTVLAAAKRLFSGEQIIDKLNIEAGAPKNFQTAVQAALDQLSRLEQGSVAISNTNVRISGKAPHPGAAARAREAAASAQPVGFRTDVAVTAGSPGPAVDGPACQQMFNEALENNAIQFPNNSATIDKESIGLLDNLVGIVRRCPSSEIEVGGHTDGSGSADYNTSLSQRRAQAVVDYLAEAGVDTSRLTARGYGRSQPIASNSTREGRARNRRIEFQVK